MGLTPLGPSSTPKYGRKIYLMQPNTDRFVKQINAGMRCISSQCFEKSNWTNCLQQSVVSACVHSGQRIEVALRCVAIHVSFLKVPPGAWQRQLCPERTKNTVFILLEPAERPASGMENCWHTFKGSSKLRVRVDRKQDVHREKALDKEGEEEGTQSVLCAACRRMTWQHWVTAGFKLDLCLVSKHIVEN